MMKSIHLKMLQKEYLYMNNILNILDYVDKELVKLGVQRKFNLYSLGGTKLMMENFKFSSKDMDFIVSREDSIILTEYLYDINKNKNVKIDLFYDGDISGYIIPDYREKAKPVSCSFNKLNLFCLDDLSFALTKIIASRDRDIKELTDFLDVRQISETSLRNRFVDFILKEDKKYEINQKFENFIKAYFN